VRSRSGSGSAFYRPLALYEQNKSFESKFIDKGCKHLVNYDVSIGYVDQIVISFVYNIWMGVSIDKEAISFFVGPENLEKKP